MGRTQAGGRVSDNDDQEFVYGEMLMPFLPVQSKGGPHDDGAFVAGFEMGRLDGLLQAAEAQGLALSDCVPDEGQNIHAENREQADLIAMRYGFIASFEEYDADEHGAEVTATWVLMRVRAAEATP